MTTSNQQSQSYNITVKTRTMRHMDRPLRGEEHGFVKTQVNAVVVFVDFTDVSVAAVATEDVAEMGGGLIDETFGVTV